MSTILFPDHVTNKIAECLRIAEEYFKTPFPMPDIDFSLRGTCAGRYCQRGSMHIIKVNRVLALENLEEYMSQTIPHEVAHYVTRKVYGYTRLGRRVQAHGKEWKSVMVKVYGLEPKRCHSYDVSNARVRHVGREYLYTCGCKTWMLTSIRHNRMVKGVKRYSCPKCKRMLKYDP